MSKKRNPAAVRLDFGKYRGRTIGEIAADDPQYLGWVLEHVENKPKAVAAIREFRALLDVPAAHGKEVAAALQALVDDIQQPMLPNFGYNLSVVAEWLAEARCALEHSDPRWAARVIGLAMNFLKTASTKMEEHGLILGEASDKARDTAAKSAERSPGWSLGDLAAALAPSVN